MVLMESSAIPIRMKISTLAAEVDRRLRNCGATITIQEKGEILTKLIVKMLHSGYSQRLRQEVLEAGAKGYFRKLQMEQAEGISVNKRAEDGRDLREVRAVAGSGSWHKRVAGSPKEKTKIIPPSKSMPGKRCNQPSLSSGKKEVVANTKEDASRKNPRTEAIIFIPVTPQGRLVELLQKLDDEFARVHNLPRIRYIEQAGSKLESILGRKNPWKGERCPRENCWPCSSGDEEDQGECFQENIVYSSSCIGCLEVGIISKYHGEISRTSYLRGN